MHCYAHQLNLILNGSSNSKKVTRFLTRLTSLANYFSRSPNKLKVLKEYTNSRLPSSSKKRWNFNSRVVCTVKENYEAILGCLIMIDENEGSTVLEASTLIHYLKADSFVFYLELFNSIFVHVSILFRNIKS